MKPDYSWTVELSGENMVERGWEIFYEAVDRIDLKGVIHNAIVDALAVALPKGRADEPPTSWRYALVIKTKP